VVSAPRHSTLRVAVLGVACCLVALVGAGLARSLASRADDAGWASGPPSVRQSVDALTAVGRQAFDADDLRGAARAFGAAVELAPDDARALFNLGTVRSAQGDASAAVDLLRRAVTVDPGFVDAQYNLGVASAAAGDRTGARLAYESVLRNRPGDSNAAWNLGLLLYQDGRRAQARDLLRHAVAQDPALSARLPADVSLTP
jgi:Flp pilus assembly protein TadD